MTMQLYVLGQSWVLQTRVSRRDPTQSAPNPSLVGLSQSLTRLLLPVPHSFEQLLQVVHEESPPLRSVMSHYMHLHVLARKLDQIFICFDFYEFQSPTFTNIVSSKNKSVSTGTVVTTNKICTNTVGFVTRRCKTFVNICKKRYTVSDIIHFFG